MRAVVERRAAGAEALTVRVTAGSTVGAATASLAGRTGTTAAAAATAATCRVTMDSSSGLGRRSPGALSAQTIPGPETCGQSPGDFGSQENRRAAMRIPIA